MTTADQLAIVNKLLLPPEEAYILAQAGLVIDCVKSKRLLVIVRHEKEQALFLLTCQAFPITCLQDVSIDSAIPIDQGFKFDFDSGHSNGPEAVFVTISSQRLRQRCLFEMLPGYHTQNFVSELFRLTELVGKQTGDSNKNSGFSWLTKYKCNLSDSGAALGLSPVEELVSVVPRMEVATGSATPIVGRDRESVVAYQMYCKEDEFTFSENFTFFVGTWNVNGQSPCPKESLSEWLGCDPSPPDLYAVGFQELDLSKEAFVFMESAKEEEWMRAVGQGLHPGATYSLVRHVRLVGMMLLIYVREELSSSVSNLSTDTVGTGIMGKLGNKGGVGVRLRLHATDLCFVNSHLAAHVEEFERRNQDFNDICARMAFTNYERQNADSMPVLGARRIKDHDQVFWLGDLNYRINDLATDEVKTMLEENCLSELQMNDQFVQQRKQRRVFVDFKEGEIKFPPTYKYDPGTNQWDSSEKARPPAWTDRVLWKGEGVHQLTYRSHMGLKVSDHKPVSATFRAAMKVVDRAKRQRIKEDIMKKLDMLENDFLPQVMVDQTDIIFDSVSFIEPAKRSMAIANTGQVPVTFEFIKKPGETSYARPWLTAEPIKGFIMPGEKADVNMEIFVDKSTASLLNSGQDKLYDILVLHLIGGKDIFITISGSYTKSCFGCSIEGLVNLVVPIRELSPGQVVSLETGESRKLPGDKVNSTDKEPYPVPKELWFLCDLITESGLDQVSLFCQPGLPPDILLLRDWLDTGLPTSNPQVSMHSVAEALLIFLDSLKEPIIPFGMYARCLESSANYLQCKQIVSQLPLQHKNVFEYLTAFLREVIAHSAQNGTNTNILATLFGVIFLRDPPGTNLEAGLRARTNQQLLERRKASFLHHFLTNDPDE